MRCVIFTEGGRGIGFGHLTRCIAVASAFQEKGWRVDFCVHGDESVVGILDGMSFREAQWMSSFEDSLEYVQTADVVLIDSYLAEENFYHRLHDALNAKLIMFDDYQRVEYPNGVIINNALTVSESDYAIIGEHCFLLGSKYIPIRRSFWNVVPKKVDSCIKSVVLSLGGDDLRNLMPLFLDCAVQVLPDADKCVVVGQAFQNRDQILSVADERTRLLDNLSADDMCDLFQEADLAVTASGQTLFETARLGLPVVSVCVAENQMNNVASWLSNGYIEFAGRWNDLSLKENICCCLRNLIPLEERKIKHDLGVQTVDGQGARRIVEHLLSNTGIFV